jgi:uncharacterized DUF497 family protein
LRFEWDHRKARLNLQKHGVSFEEALSAFYDEFAIEYVDTGHGDDEDRYLLLGMSRSLRILMICHSFREEEGVIRIISARKATKRESSHYERP